MNQDSESFNLNELCALADLPRRTVRYYIQIGLIDRPRGATRSARYTREHLHSLLEIRRWQKAGLALDRIRELLRAPEAADLPVPPPAAGVLQVWSRLTLAPGIELHIDPRQAGLTSEQVRNLARRILQSLDSNHEEPPP